MSKMTGWKGFGPDWKCRNKFQYEVGGEYEEENASLCDRGFHFCESPLDVLNYYPFLNDDAKFNNFAEVEADGVTEQKSGDSKRVASKLKVVADIGIHGLVKAAINYVREAVKENKATTGYRAHSATTGYRAHSATTGDLAHSATTGDLAHSATTGDFAHSATTGNDAHSATTGKNSIAAAIGIDSRAKAEIGGWIVLTEWEETDDEWRIKDIRGSRVDGEKVKPGVFYVLRNGEFIEAGKE